MGYTNEYSNFPNTLYTLHNYKDADDTIAPLVNQIRGYMASGNYDQARYFIDQNKAVLEPYVLNMETINALEEEIRNLEIYAISKVQSIYITLIEPSAPEVNDVWIQ